MDDMRQGVVGVLHEVLGQVSVDDSTTAKDVPGWDSLKQVMILTGIEERFGLQFSSREMDALRSVGDLIELVARKVGRTAGSPR